MNYLTVTRKGLLGRLGCIHSKIVCRKVSRKKIIAEPEYYEICLRCGRIHRIKSTKHSQYRPAIITGSRIYIDVETRN